MCSIIGYCGHCADMEKFQTGFQRTLSRGPDDSRVVKAGAGLLGFHRLAIMGLHPEGMQPFSLDGSYVVCNGEIYGFEKLREKLRPKYEFHSESDCEVLLPLYREYGTDMFAMLDAEFAMVLYDAQSDSFVAARDPIGIRPLYYGYDPAGTIIFASEPKNLLGLTDRILPFPPGHYYKDGKFVCYRDLTKVAHVVTDDVETVCANIHEKLVAGVRKRLVADAKVGFLLSGGLDSSLVCAIAARESAAPIKTFAIGMSGDAIDLKYAKEVADYIGSDHTAVIISREDVLAALEPVIALLGIILISGACLFSFMRLTPPATLARIGELPLLHRLPTWADRMRGSGELPANPEDYDITKNPQVAHATIAIATCNIIGRGPGNSVERDFLPQSFSDFIYAIVIEELGLAGGIFVMFLYIVLLFRSARIASRCERNFPAFLVMGLSLMLVIQAMVNMAVAVGVFPVTGQPLPLVSKGGTSTMINCAYIGVILSVSRSAKRKNEADVVELPADEVEEPLAETISDGLTDKE